MRRRCNGDGALVGHAAARVRRRRRRENYSARRIRQATATTTETTTQSQLRLDSVAPVWTGPVTEANFTTDHPPSGVTINDHWGAGRKFSALLLVAAAGCCCFGTMGPTVVRASEFPERECCDPVYPPLPDPDPIPPGGGPVLPTTTISTSSSGGMGGLGMGGTGGLGGLPGGLEGPEGIVVGSSGGIGHVGVSKNTIGYSGPNIKTAIAILNCILARQLCFEDPSCSAILEIIPRVCGPVPVACSTVTVTKCQAALRTLQAFPFFRPTCLCKEPGIDPDCNYFRDFLFDHPCGFVSKKEKDPYPVDALPTCNHALSVCQQERKCIKLFEDFKLHCKVRENKCRMEDRELCYEAWTNLRLSPMFGCICPNNHMKRRCDKIFSVVNHNPCVDVLPSALDTSSGTATNSIYPNFYPSDVIEDPPPTSTYPYFLFPSKKYPPSAFEQAIYNGADYINVPAAGSPNLTHHHSHYPTSNHDSVAPPAQQHHFTSSTSTRHEHNFDGTGTANVNHNYMHPSPPPSAPNQHGKQQHHHSLTPSSTSTVTNSSSSTDDSLHHHQHHQHQPSDNAPWSGVAVAPDLRQRIETVRAMGMDDNYHRLLDQNMALIETPLVAPAHAYFPQHFKTALYPYNISGYHRQHQHGMHGGHFGSPHGNGNGHNGHNGGGMEYGYHLEASVAPAVGNILISMDGEDDGADAAIENGKFYDNAVERHIGSDDIEEKEAEMSFIHFQSTCHLAMDACRSDSSCYPAFKTVMMHCDLHRCNRNACMNSLQSFYKGIHDDLSLDIAFCLCRKTPNRHDSCMIAQEKLHPACAQRPPENLSAQESSNGALFSPPPSCHAVAEMCRQEDDCRSRLEVFEQSCAVDSVTKKCAGKTSACRQAMLGILGTPLRTNCACQGSEVQQLYDCLGWQRLLWLNPCVVESQKDFHLKRLAELGLLTTTTTPTTTTMRTTRTTQAPTPPPTKPKPVYRPKPTVAQPIETNYIETPDTRPETLVHKGNELIVRTDLDLHPTELEPRGKSVHSFPEVDHQEEDHEEEDHYRHTNGNNRIPHQRPDEQVLQMLTTEAEIETLPPTTTTTTTTEPTTTPVPIRYCVVQRSQQSDQHIAEGKSRRLYMLDDAECSELCTCGAGETLSLSCHALCVPLAPCRTSLAYYSHAAPAYQAYRGRCLCYSGRFICMRPPPGEYSLPGGIFLLLGYSSTDEALLRPHTNLGVQDAVRALQQYVQQHINNETSCILTLFNITEENIILSIRLPPDSKLSNMELLRLEKDHCTKILETISHQINHQHVEMSAHRLLSIFKMAEVQVVWPEVNRATPGATRGPHSVTLLLALVASSVIPFVRWGSISSLRWSVT